MRSLPADNVGVTFVSLLLGRGVMNGVINLTFGTFNFTPDTEQSNGVDLDAVVSARLRMDIPCARQLHETLGKLLESIDSKENTPALPTPTNEGVASGKPN